MLRFPISVVVLAAALVVGCSATDDSRAAGSSLIWKASSQRIELSSFGYWQGSSGYTKERAALTPEQLHALEGLRAIGSPPSRVGADVTSYRLRVLDADGTVAEYRAAQANLRDSDESAGAAALPTVDIATLEPFLATFRCLAAKEVNSLERTTASPVDPAKVDVENGVSLPSDPGCINGVFVPYTCSDALLTFDVDAKATYDIVGGRCLESLGLRVYSGDRTTLLTESSPGTPESCFRLRHTFEPGSYVFVFSKTNGAGCTTNGQAGDTSLRIHRVP